MGNTGGVKISVQAVQSALYKEISLLIEESKANTVVQVNSAMTLLFWQIGKRINTVVLEYKRASYGKQIVVTLSRQLETQYGRGFEEKNVRRMLQFADTFPDEEIVVTLSRQLSWSHFVALIPLKTGEQRQFYAHHTSYNIPEFCTLNRYYV